MEGPNAVLNVMTIPPGATKTQARLVIDGVRGAIFLYQNGGPLGALIGSWAMSAGTDPYGNVYPQGLKVTLGTISGTTITGGTITGTVIQSSSLAPGVKIDASGNIIVFNSFGAIIAEISPSKDGFFVYADTGSATQGALIASAAGTNGTDPVNGATYQTGVNSYVVVSGVTYAVGLNALGVGGLLPGLSIQDVANAPNTSAGVFGEASNGTTKHAKAILASGAVTVSDAPATVQVKSSTDSAVANGLCLVIAGDTTIGFINTLDINDNKGIVSLLQQLSATPANSGKTDFFTDINGIPRYTNPFESGNVYPIGAMTQSLSGTQLISSTTPTQITNMSWAIQNGVRYVLDMMLTWTGAGTVGSAVFGFNGTSVSTQQSTFFWTQGPASGTGTGGNISSPTLVTTRQGLIYKALIVCTTSGTFNVRAQISSGGSNFTINNSYATLTPA